MPWVGIPNLTHVLWSVVLNNIPLYSAESRGRAVLYPAVSRCPAVSCSISPAVSAVLYPAVSRRVSQTHIPLYLPLYPAVSRRIDILQHIPPYPPMHIWGPENKKYILQSAGIEGGRWGRGPNCVLLFYGDSPIFSTLLISKKRQKQKKTKGTAKGYFL
jgi:hypothetical protein